MRISKVEISPIALYSEPLWNMSYSYRVILVAWRVLEVGFIVARFVLIRAPFVLLWTRLPLTRDITLPGWYKELQGMLGPRREAMLAVSGGRVGEGQLPFIDSYESVEDLKRQMDILSGIVKPPGPIKVMIGGILRGLIMELGSVYIKLAQIVSMRPEVPPFLREELQLVQDKLPGLPEEEVKIILKRELLKPVEDIFEWVDYTPVHAASLAILHHAKLKDGREVALKIQRPFLAGRVAIDTVIILRLGIGFLRLLFPVLRRTDLTFFTLSFERNIKKEINFELEGHIQDYCRRTALDNPVMADGLYIAEPYFDYTTKKLLVMEYVTGFLRIDEAFNLPLDEIWDLLSYKMPGMPEEIPAQAVVLGARFPMHMAWHSGIWHGDLHAGNAYVMRPRYKGDRFRFFLCDFGMYEDVTREDFQGVLMLLWGLLAGSPQLATDGLRYCHLQGGGNLTEVDWDALYGEMLSFGRVWLEEAPEEEAGIKLRRSKLGEGGLTRQILILLYGQIMGSDMHLPYWMWLLLKSYAQEEELGLAVMGGSYDWFSWIFDQYTVRVEQDSLYRYFDRTNVFGMRKIPDALKPMLLRGKDYEKVMGRLAGTIDEIARERILVSLGREEA